METEEWLHAYRKLDREKDLLHFSSASKSTNFADSRLKFKRNFSHLLQKLYLLESADKHVQDQFLSLIEFLLRQNTSLH